MLKIGMIVDNRYKVLRVIGRGGSSCVYLVENIRLHSYWAIKEIYKSGVTVDGAHANMLIAESGILTKLRHPGMPSIIDILSTPQSYLIVMEYVEGISLDKVLAQRGACAEKDVIKWGQQLCDVLTYLHTQQPPIIYRDMKPANIMLKPDGHIVLIDFGLAREFKIRNVHDTAYLGTHGYAAPEQYDRTRQTDARTDIYGLGVTLYHLVTGRDPCQPPYGINSICAANPTLSKGLDAIIQKCTQLRPEQRFQTAKELSTALTLTDSSDKPAPASGGNNKWAWLFALIPAAIIFTILAVVLIKNVVTWYFGLVDPVKDDFVGTTEGIAESNLCFEKYVSIDEPDERKYYTFVPEKTGFYEIYSVSGAADPVIWLTDKDDLLVDEDNTTGEYTEAAMECWLYAWETYCIETTLYDLDPYIPSTGEYWIYVEYAE